MEHWLATCNKNVNLSSIAEHFNLYHNCHILSKDKPLLSLKIIDRANSCRPIALTSRIGKILCKILAGGHVARPLVLCLHTRILLCK